MRNFRAWRNLDRQISRGRNPLKGRGLFEFPAVAIASEFVRARAYRRGKCGIFCESKFIFANKCSVTVEISDWSLDASRGKRGSEVGERDAKREITANRIRKERRDRLFACFGSSVSIFAYFYALAGAIQSGGRE